MNGRRTCCAASSSSIPRGTITCVAPLRTWGRTGSWTSSSGKVARGRSNIRTTSCGGGSRIRSTASRSTTGGWNMLPESVEEKIAAVAGDHQSGATHLAERSLRAFDLLMASGQLGRAAVQELSHRLEEGQPAMASIRHVVRLATKVLLENLDHWPGFREAMQRELEEGKRRGARHFGSAPAP